MNMQASDTPHLPCCVSGFPWIAKALRHKGFPTVPLGVLMAVDRLADLEADYVALGQLLSAAEGSAAAAIVRERRIIGEMLEALQSPAEVPLVDQLADRRKSRTKPAGAASRRRKSG